MDNNAEMVVCYMIFRCKYFVIQLIENLLTFSLPVLRIIDLKWGILMIQKYIVNIYYYYLLNHFSLNINFKLRCWVIEIKIQTFQIKESKDEKDRN